MGRVTSDGGYGGPPLAQGHLGASDSTKPEVAIPATRTSDPGKASHTFTLDQLRINQAKVNSTPCPPIPPNPKGQCGYSLRSQSQLRNNYCHEPTYDHVTKWLNNLADFDEKEDPRVSQPPDYPDEPVNPLDNQPGPWPAPGPVMNLSHIWNTATCRIPAPDYSGPITTSRPAPAPEPDPIPCDNYMK